LAPRPALLTYNSKDDCCFESGYALPPLVEAAGPVYKLLGKEKSLRTHVNDVPGTHNFEKDNRQAYYRMLGDFFFNDPKFDADEIPSDKELKKPDELRVPLPDKNADFNALARNLMKSLPKDAAWPTEKSAAATWQTDRRDKLWRTVKAMEFPVSSAEI